MKVLKTIIFLGLFSFSFAQGNLIEWEKSFDSASDYIESIQQTSDGGYIVAGYSLISENNPPYNVYSDYWIIKLDDLGNTEWQKLLGGSGDDRASSIQQTSDGGYIVAGSSESYDGDVTGINGYADYWILKLDDLGNIEWEKALGGSDWESAKSIQQTIDGGYIVSGVSNSTDGNISNNMGSYDYWIVKLDDLGNIEWEKSLGGSNSDAANSIQQTTDGGFIVAGYSFSMDGDVTEDNFSRDYWIVKLDNLGNIEWEKSLGGSSAEEAESIQQTTDGGYIVAGGSNSNDGDVTGNHGSYDYWIIKLSDLGNIEWEKSLGGSSYDVATSIQQTIEGGYIVGGYSRSVDGDVSMNNGEFDYWIVKLDNLGAIEWEYSFGGPNTDLANSIQQTTDGGYVVAGYRQFIDGDNDYWIVKLGPDASVHENKLVNLNISPNPAKNEVVISVDSKLKGTEFTIINNAGKIILKESFRATEHKVDLSAFENGVYFISAEEGSKPLKLIKQ